MAGWVRGECGGRLLRCFTAYGSVGGRRREPPPAQPRPLRCSTGANERTRRRASSFSAATTNGLCGPGQRKSGQVAHFLRSTAWATVLCFRRGARHAFLISWRYECWVAVGFCAGRGGVIHDGAKVADFVGRHVESRGVCQALSGDEVAFKPTGFRAEMGTSWLGRDQNNHHNLQATRAARFPSAPAALLQAFSSHILTFRQHRAQPQTG